MKLSTLILAGTVASLALAGPAAAQMAGGVTVKGDVKIDADVGDVTTMAIGENAIAETLIASVTGHNTEVGGDVTIKVKVGDVTTIAEGDGARACTAIGVVGTTTCQAPN
ncbi:MAG: hypothetical protein AAF074_05735 [Pseudomonadota bacterium]